jgi:hypothetical protein
LSNKPKQLDPYRGGKNDEEFLRFLGIDPADAQRVADALDIPLSEPTETYPDATGKSPNYLADVSKVVVNN